MMQMAVAFSTDKLRFARASSIREFPKSLLVFADTRLRAQSEPATLALIDAAPKGFGKRRSANT